MVLSLIQSQLVVCVISMWHCYSHSSFPPSSNHLPSFPLSPTPHWRFVFSKHNLWDKSGLKGFLTPFWVFASSINVTPQLRFDWLNTWQSTLLSKAEHARITCLVSVSASMDRRCDSRGRRQKARLPSIGCGVAASSSKTGWLSLHRQWKQQTGYTLDIGRISYTPHLFSHLLSISISLTLPYMTKHWLKVITFPILSILSALGRAALLIPILTLFFSLCAPRPSTSYWKCWGL